MDIVPEAEPQSSVSEAVQEPALYEPSARRQNSFFFGRFGLRAGWGIAIFLIVWIVFGSIGQIFGVAATGQLRSVMTARMQAQAHPNAPHPQVHVDFYAALVIVADGISFLAMLGMCWFFSRGERRRFGVYGIGSNRWKDIFPGAFLGLAAMSLLVAVLHARHLLIFDSRALYGSAVVTYGLKWLLAFLLVGFAEEYAFRGYIQYTLMRGLWGLAEKFSPTNPRPTAYWLSATTLSALFLAAHLGNTGENPVGLIQVFLAGMLFAYALWRTGSLWLGIGIHMTWDWAQSFLFGVADSGNISVGRLYVTHPTGNPLLSGGSAGPEGSIYGAGAILLLFLAVRLIRSGAQPALEQESFGMAALHEAPTLIS